MPRLLDNRYVGLVIACICGMIIIFVLPIWYVQITNIIFGNTTHGKYAYRKNGVFSSMSSSNSIWRKDSEDWSYYSRKSIVEKVPEEVGCCSKYRVPKSSSEDSSKINEEI